MPATHGGPRATGAPGRAGCFPTEHVGICYEQTPAQTPAQSRAVTRGCHGARWWVDRRETGDREDPGGSCPPGPGGRRASAPHQTIARIHGLGPQREVQTRGRAPRPPNGRPVCWREQPKKGSSVRANHRQKTVFYGLGCTFTVQVATLFGQGNAPGKPCSGSLLNKASHYRGESAYRRRKPRRYSMTASAT